MLRDADHHSPKSCNQFYFLWYTSQELCFFFFFPFLYANVEQTKPSSLFSFSFFAFLPANAEQTKPSSLFLFLFLLFSLPMRSKPNRRFCFFFAFRSAKPNRRLCIFYWFKTKDIFSWRISEAITQTTFGSLKSVVGQKKRGSHFW